MKVEEALDKIYHVEAVIASESDISSRANDGTNEIATLRQELSLAVETVRQLSEKYEVLKRTLESRSESKDEGIFFHVSRESSFNSISHPMSTVVYQHQLVDIGGGIDAASGTFTVPRDGVYSFNFSGLKLHRERDETMGIDLRMNGKVIGVTRTAAGIDCGTLSLTAVLQLKAGDRVETILRNNNKDGICRDLHCHFTGALLNLV